MFITPCADRFRRFQISGRKSDPLPAQEFDPENDLGKPSGSLERRKEQRERPKLELR